MIFLSLSLFSGRNLAVLSLSAAVLGLSTAPLYSDEPSPEVFEAERAENLLRESPGDLSLRISLIRYYHAQYADPEVRSQRVPHVLWLIENHPAHPMAGDVRARLHPAVNGTDYDSGAALWKQHADYQPGNPVIMANAGRYLAARDRDAAISFLQRAADLEPANPEWPLELSAQRKLAAAALRAERPERARELFAAALADLEMAQERADDRERRFSILTRLPEVAMEAGKPVEAGDWAQKLLGKAEMFPTRDRNRANAEHSAHTTLGRIALQNGDTLSAGRHLLLSAQVRGSPELNSVGPSLVLARGVLALGETDAVITFLHLCGNFWVAGRPDLDRWTEEIRRTGVSDFSRRFHEQP